MRSLRLSPSVLTLLLMMTPVLAFLGPRTHQLSRIMRASGRVLYRQMSSSTGENVSSQLERVVYQSLSQECNVSPSSLVLLSVSGGLDSMSMLHLLQSISTKYLPMRLEVVSFNHKLRPEADEEISFIRSWAAEYGMRFHERILPEHQRGSSGLQARAREWRRSECSRILLDHPDKSDITAAGGALHYATAHHADDQVETMLLKLLRGSSISNLNGISPKSDDGNGVHIIRPLLKVTKDQLREYMTARGLNWREDESNASRKYKRNKVRLDLIPLMESLAGGTDALKKRFEALEEQSYELQDWTNTEVESYFRGEYQNRNVVNPVAIGPGKGLSASIRVGNGSSFSLLPSPLVQREVIRRVYQLLVELIDQNTSPDRGANGLMGDAITLNYEMISNVLQLASENLSLGVRQKSIQLSKQVLVTRLGDTVTFEEIVSNKPGQSHGKLKRTRGEDEDSDTSDGTHNNEDEIMLTVDVEGAPERSLRVVFPKGLKVMARVVDQSTSSPVVSAETKPFTLATTTDDLERDTKSSSVTVVLHNIPINIKLRVRFPLNGDRFLPVNKTGTSPVRLVDFLRRSKLPLECRSLVPVITLSVDSDVGDSTENCATRPVSVTSNNTVRNEEELGSRASGEVIISVPPFVGKHYAVVSAGGAPQGDVVSVAITIEK